MVIACNLTKDLKRFNRALWRMGLGEDHPRLVVRPASAPIARRTCCIRLDYRMMRGAEGMESPYLLVGAAVTAPV
ncbi:MAG TPA: hypothetical protein DCQ33_11740 [Nitrospira sp.]|nr:hypothetical protein [Nitrospira sp.]